jgi:XRE family transcriptional regulator of biofilm formation
VLDVSVNDIIQHHDAIEETELDSEWLDLTKEAMHAGVSKEEFKEFMEFNKARKEQ